MKFFVKKIPNIYANDKKKALGYCRLVRLSQLYKGAVGATLCQNEAELKISKEIDYQISFTDQAGKIWWKF